MRLSTSLLLHHIIYFQLILSSSCSAATDSPENLFRKTTKAWRSRRDWNVWVTFKNELLSMFSDNDDGTGTVSNSNSNSNSDSRLEIVGAMEEGILAIEKATVAMGEGVDVKRDNVLSQMYTGYGQMLSLMNAEECQALALDPHTLLIGAETVSRGDEPSTFLCLENAENALRNASTLDATNTVADELLEKITGETNSIHQRKPKEFVAELFDSFADTFDEKLLHNLEYKVPKIVGDTVGKLKRKFKAVLDAGCGTGLAGRTVRPFVTDVMVGVDASQKMLDIAAKCTFASGCGMEVDETEAETETKTTNSDDSPPLYEGLLQLDLEDMTVENTLRDVDVSPNDFAGFDLVIAADVFVYFGSLDTVLASFANVSVSGANLVFSCELATDEEAPLGFRLLSSGRFAHTKQHVIGAALKADYNLLSYEEIVPRMERGEEVKGHLFTFVLGNGNRPTDEL